MAKEEPTPFTVIEVTPGRLEITNGSLTLTVDSTLAVLIESDSYGFVVGDARAIIEGAEVLKRELTERYGAWK